MRRPLVAYYAVLLLLLPALAGCGKDDDVSRYRVPKQHVLEQSIGIVKPASGNKQPGAPATDRMLAAVIPGKDQTWFFKVSGPDKVVAAKEESFLAFIQSVNFAGPDGSKPEWTLPEGWRKQPGGSSMRYATLQIGTGEQPLELSVIPLPTAGGNQDDYVLSNVNRWRGQLSLAPITLDELLDDESPGNEISRFDLDGGTTVTMVNFVGALGSNGMGRPPFASGPRGAPSGARPLGPNRPDSTAGRAPMNSPLTYDVPEGWTPGEVRGLRKAAFVVSDGARKIEITAIPLPASGLLSNVNRWCAQIQLAPKTQQELDRQIESITVGQTAGQFIELVGPEDTQPRESILGAIVNRGDTAWFFKLKGDVELAAREKERFKAFVQSVRFKATDGAGDGN